MRLRYFASGAMLAVLAACGGGGGGGGGGFVPVQTPMTLGVTINGSAATADSSGAYAVKPGDKVEVTSNQAAGWTTTSSVANAVSLLNPSVADTRWSAQVVSASSSVVSYTITAKAAANASLSKDAVLKVAPADARNGDYTVFEVNGTQQKLTVNFDTSSYAMTDPAGAVSSGSFSADPAEPGTYVFSNSRITSAVNAARFRASNDAVVGAFPFAVANSNPVSYDVQPFIAARSFVTTQAQLDGDYNRFSALRAITGRDSAIGSIRVTNGGTTLIVCNDAVVYAIDQCPVGSQVTYSVAQGATPDRWEGTNVANPDPNLRAIFYMARIGGQNVYLRSSYSMTTTTKFMNVGLPASADWPTFTGYGASTTGTWGRTTIAGSSYTRVRTNPDGTTGTSAYVVEPQLPLMPPGLRSVNVASPDSYFAMQGAKLSVVVGARNPSTVGYISFALSD